MQQCPPLQALHPVALHQLKALVAQHEALASTSADPVASAAGTVVASATEAPSSTAGLPGTSLVAAMRSAGPQTAMTGPLQPTTGVTALATLSTMSRPKRYAQILFNWKPFLEVLVAVHEPAFTDSGDSAVFFLQEEVAASVLPFHFALVGRPSYREIACVSCVDG